MNRREFITLLGGAAATQTGKRHYLTQRSRPCAGERRYRVASMEAMSGVAVSVCPKHC
jgi:hypothetical protein